MKTKTLKIFIGDEILTLDDVVEFSFGKMFFYYVKWEERIFKCYFREREHIYKIQMYNDNEKGFKNVKTRI